MTRRHTTVTSDASQLPELTEFLRGFWSEAGLPAAEAVPFELALEEVFMNVVMHGSHGERTPQVEVSLALRAREVTLIVEDDGPPFDPLDLAAPDLTASLEDRPIGGLGVFLVRKMMDSVQYQRRGVRNRLQMTKQLAASLP